MMIRPLRGLLIATLAAGMTGSTIGVLAQDDPFAGTAGEASQSSPFDMPESGEASSPFEPTFGEAAPSDPFGGAAEQAAPSSPFGGAAEAPAPGDPFGGAAEATTPGSPFGGAVETTPQPAPLGGATDTASDPFGAGTAPSDDPFGMDSGTSSPFAGLEEPSTGGAAASGSGSGSGIATLFEFRYVPRDTNDGRTIISRKMMTTDEAAEWDRKVLEYYKGLAQEGDLANYVEGQNDLDDWASWMLYADQVQLWLQYCNQVALVGLEPEVTVEDIVWPGTEQEETEEEEGRPQRPDNIINENRSLDDQLADFNPVPDTRNQQNIPVIDPQVMNDKIAGVYDQVLSQLRDYEQGQQTVMAKLDRDLTDRELQRQAYDEWREVQKDQIIEFVDEWSRRYEGQVVMIEGVRYELYRPGTVPPAAPRGTNIVETDYDLTPYDLLNEDGTLRGPAR